MKINPKLRQDLIKYNLNFPTDARTKEYKAEVAKYKAPELYKLALQSKVEKAKIIQRDIDRKAKKEANKKARAEKKAEMKNLKRYIGSIYTTLFVVFKRKPEEKRGEQRTAYISKTHIIDVKVNEEELENALLDIINEYIEEVIEESDVETADLINRKDSIQIVNNNKIKPLNKIRMKQSGVGIYDGYDNQEWSTNTGRCVFDYIKYRYGNIKGFKTVCNDNESLCKIFYDIDDDEDEVNNPLDLLNVGVNTNNIKRFCEKFNIPMYAIDEIENTFSQFIPKNRNKNAPAFIYLLSNTHIYPINDTNKIKSIVKITSMINNVNSDIIETYKPKKEDEGDDIKDKLENVVFVDNIGDKLLEILNEGKIPVKIKLNDKQLVSFYIGKIKYISNKDINIIKELCANMKIEYNGQGIGTLLINIIKEATGKDKLSKSIFNPNVSKTLDIAVKARARIGIIDDDYKQYQKSDLMAWDINKCYSACMYDPSEDWIRLDFNDTWEDYDGELKLGLYYVKTDDTTLFKKSGYYSTCIIKKAIYEGIDFEIIKQLIPSHKQDKNTLTKIIDVIMKYSNGNTSISKRVINLMSGMLGQSSTRTSKNIKINNDIDQIFNFLNKYYELEDGIMMNKIEDTPYYMYGFNKEVIFNENNRPMYIQVLDESNIKRYDMAKAMGGKVVAYKVDCVVVLTDNKINRCDTEWGGYTSCDIPNITRKEKIDVVSLLSDKEWNDNKHLKLNDSDKWQDIYNLLINKKGLLLQASAGNGKTYTAKMIASKLGDRVKIIAPTNKAALNIGGSTIHRFLEMNADGYIKPNKINMINDKYDVIIIDEISMISKELWRRLCLLKQELPHLIFLLLGDEKQIPPVEEETIQDYFNHPAVKYLCNYNKNILNVRKRYDETLYNLLEDVNNININDKVAYPKLTTTRNICYFNKTRIRVNKMWNDKLRKSDALFIPKYTNPNNENDEHAKQSQDMYIYNGLPVIAMRTKFDKEEGLLFANSETFEICDIGEDYISMYNERPDDNGNKELYVYNCPIEDFNKYFLMNYCSTTHKCQGETIVENFTIYDWNAMDTKLRYTALSRGKKVDQVCFN
jgi:hypothetical protein